MSEPTDTPEGATPSSSCPSLVLLEGQSALALYLQTLLSAGRRTVDLFSDDLDPRLFASDEVAGAISQIARRHRQARVRLLVRDTSLLQGRHHPLVELQQRLCSRIDLRQCVLENDSERRNYVIVDGRQLWLLHQGGEYQGFCNSDAAAEAKALQEDFEQRWQQHSREITELRKLSI